MKPTLSVPWNLHASCLHTVFNRDFRPGMFRYPCPFRPPVNLTGNDEPALEAIYEGYPPATGAPCILNSLHTSGCVGYQPPKSKWSSTHFTHRTTFTLILRSYPWRCLCFGFSQIMRTLPFLLITLHFSQIGFTDDLTFMWDPPFIHCFAFVCTAQIPVLRLLPRLIGVLCTKMPGKRAYIL